MFKNKNGDISMLLTITAGKENLGLGFLASSVVMSQRSNGLIYFSSLPDRMFRLVQYTWGGPTYISRTTSTSKRHKKEKSKEKERRKGGLGGAVLGTAIMPGVGTAIGYAMTSKKVKTGKNQATANVRTATDETQTETDNTAKIQVADINSGVTFSFGIRCNSKIDVELDGFNWSNIEDIREAQKKMNQRETENIKLLKQYKELLDMGAISQEEYDDKKHKLLNDELPSMETQHKATTKTDVPPNVKPPKKKKRMGCLVWVLVILLCFVSCVAIISGESEDSAPDVQESTPAMEPAIPVFYIDLAYSYSNYLGKIVETTIPADSFQSTGNISTHLDMLANRICAVIDDESYSQKSNEIKYITVRGEVSYEYSEVRIRDCTVLYAGMEPPQAYSEQLKAYKEMVILGKLTEREAFLNSAEKISYADLRKNPDSNKDKTLVLTVSIIEVEPDGLFLNGIVTANYQGKTIYIYDERENREPRLSAGDRLTIYATGRGLTTVKTYEKGTGILGSDLGANVVSETEEVAVTMLYTDKEDISAYDVTSKNEYAYYLKGVEYVAMHPETTPAE